MNTNSLCPSCGKPGAPNPKAPCLSCWLKSLKGVHHFTVDLKDVPAEGITRHWVEEEARLQSLGCRCERDVVDLHSPGCPAVNRVLTVPWGEEDGLYPKSLPAEDELRLHSLGVSWK